MDFSERMAAKLKEARNKAHVSAIDAGDAVGRSDKTIYAWENNKSEPSAEQLISLCNLYGVDISFFYSQEPEEKAGQDLDEGELVRIYRDLDDSAKKALLAIARDLSIYL